MNSETGLLLKQARENLGIDTQSVEKELKIRGRIIAALEAGAFDKLPDPVTSVGLVKTYAKTLGLDPEAVAYQFKEEMRLRGVKKREIDFPETALPGTFKPMKYAAPAALALILLGGYFGIFNEKPKHADSDISKNAAAIIYEKTGQDVTPEGAFQQLKAPDAIVASPSTASATDKTPASETTAQTANVAPQAIENNTATITTTPAPSVTGAEGAQVIENNLNALVQEQQPNTTAAIAVDAPKDAIILTAPRGESWIEIKEQGGKTIYSGLLPKDGSYVVPVSSKPLLLKVGAGFALDVSVAGEIVTEPFGAGATVLRNIPLNAETIKNFKQP